MGLSRLVNPPRKKTLTTIYHPSPCLPSLTIRRRLKPQLLAGHQRKLNSRKMLANLRLRRKKSRRQPRPRKTRRLAISAKFTVKEQIDDPVLDTFRFLFSLQ